MTDTTRLPAPLRANLADLPAAAADAIRAARATPEDARRRSVEAAGIRFSALEWGPAGGRPLLLLHGVISSARSFWRIGPALGALGWRAIAPDLPGHGRTGGGADGRGYRFAETACVVATFTRAAFGADGRSAGAGSAAGAPDGRSADAGSAAGGPDGRIAVIGHSWGAMLAANLPSAGLRPVRIVLLEPPVMARTALEAMVNDPAERPDTSPDSALATLEAEHPEWPEGERIVKAEALTQVSAAAAIAVLLGNGDWDAGAAALSEPAAAGIPVWIVRGDAAAGGLVPAAWLPRLADLVGGAHVLTIADGAHTPQRRHVEATTLALIRALEG